MKYTYRINGVSNSGKPSIVFHCEHCGKLHFDLAGALYFAQLEHDPRIDIEAAAMEFINRLNTGDTAIFAKQRTWNKIVKSLCNCDPDVIDIERYKAVQRAK